MSDSHADAQASAPPKIEAQAVPVGQVRMFDLQEAGWWHFAPQDDITPLEIANLVNMAMVAMNHRSPQPLDWKSYAMRHMLMRHFTFHPIIPPTPMTVP